jgi:dipeptidyl aminopeptidase/acylaminoacyl peptidase
VGVTNWRSLHGTSAIGAWDRQYLRDDPYRVGGEYDNRSPLTHVRQVSTPTLLVNGSADVIVPPGQAIEFASALRELGEIADVRIYRDEGHDLSSRRTQVELANDVTGWFGRWLLTE